MSCRRKVETHRLGLHREGGAGRRKHDATIVRAAIYPAIGIARVGNCETAYFLAPEVTDPLPEPVGFYRDPTGALKRQAVRFRIYGLNEAGVPVARCSPPQHVYAPPSLGCRGW